MIYGIFTRPSPLFLLQEEMDFEYAMTLHNAESQVQPPPCHRLPEYHSHDSESPTTMLTRGMRQATRGQLSCRA